MNEQSMRPSLLFLSKEDKDKIHQAALQILADIGMQILHEDALALLKSAGCSVKENNIVQILKVPEANMVNIEQ